MCLPRLVALSLSSCVYLILILFVCRMIRHRMAYLGIRCDRMRCKKIKQRNAFKPPQPPSYSQPPFHTWHTQPPPHTPTSTFVSVMKMSMITATMRASKHLSNVSKGINACTEERENEIAEKTEAERNQNKEARWKITQATARKVRRGGADVTWCERKEIRS